MIDLFADREVIRSLRRSLDKCDKCSPLGVGINGPDITLADRQWWPIDDPMAVVGSLLALHIMISLMVLKLPPDLLCSPFFLQTKKRKKENATLKICSDRLTYLLQCILMKQYDLIYTGPDLLAKWFSKFE
ncbi:hypothetical protein BLOT_013595 [Blomia tropicalis]|nr:hypothetical protein BLOT_013595 [Blomia tropicalis]